ncbi:MAG TPA: 2,3-bisphosphoglycerate-independent phosphoglycerate mutase [Candidatus Avoscillospira avistercoris]|uniref:2,3-bisphosphoglycerate-independent phosphoglycerate mutase n=1 Tax=Candidatus Avoscillospira avistercoris TaxID=2840707 RepID=A0A9D1JTB6_9FIRM|nr:2,3-bisphosphoglycerate-independent phosphoglycerate mutase [Candidatus Avoscillospira avistercoris]
MKKPVVLVIMDGVGRGDGGPGDAVKQANTPTLDKLFATCPYTWLKAHGTAVGLPSDDDMGNSEVGHNALGCGQVYAQGAKLVSESIESGKLFQSKTWKKLADNAKNGKTLHFLGLLSDGNVHSNISHLFALLRQAKAEGIHSVCCHILLDGRDVPATSALEYVQQLEDVLASLSGDGYDYRIASGGGRMTITMDRYEANWPMVELGWKTHVRGEGRQFADAKTAIETYRTETGCIDQDLPPFVIAKDGKPVGTIANGDSVILFNFRGDRAQEISLAFDRKDFDKFDRGNYTGVEFAGMLEYDGDLHIPTNYLVEPPVIQNTLTEVLCAHKVREYALSETQKYGHVTYFWNGNRSGKVCEELETYEEIPSDVIPFDQAPAMKSVEITDHMVEAMASGKYDFLRCNFPNGDMVGHTGSLEAAITAMEYVDKGLSRILEAADKYGYAVCVTADHGNADQMTETKKGKTSVRTAHSLNPVPFIIYDPDTAYTIKEGNYGLANVAPTLVKMMEIPAPDCWEASMI